MKNNTASNKLGRLVTTARFEAITGLELNSATLHRAMTQGLTDGGDVFRTILLGGFSPVELTCDMRKSSTWEALATAIARFDAQTTSTTEQQSVEPPSDLENSPSIATTEQQSEKITVRSDTPSLETPLEVWHLDDSNWRDARIMQMGEWHPCFKEVEWKFRRSMHPNLNVLKEYAQILLSTSTDAPDDLLRHLHEEVVPYLANKLVEAVDDAWRDALATTIRPNSPVKEFEQLIGECQRMLA